MKRREFTVALGGVALIARSVRPRLDEAGNRALFSGLPLPTCDRNGFIIRGDYGFKDKHCR
jgi:hypothetical protein